MSGAVDMDKLATASIEDIEAMATAQSSGAEGDKPAATGEKTETKAEDKTGAADANKQDVTTATSGQAAQQHEQVQKESDKELNFAKLRAKTEALEREAQRLKEENERLAKRSYTAELPADHAQKVSEVDARLTAIAAQYQEGDMTWDDYQAQLRQATTERESLIATALKAEISKEMREQAERDAIEAERASWERTVDNFINSKPDAVDYAADEAKQRDLNIYVKALAADPDNADKGYDWYLNEAHALVKAKHRIEPSAPAKQEPKPDENKDQQPGKPSIPFNSLSDVPGGIPPARSEAEQLDQLSGAALTNRFMNDPAAIERALNSLA